MPIVKNENTTQLEFGHGDIEVAPALLQNDEVIGAVCFFRRKHANPIGERGDFEPNMVVEMEHTPVRMTFEKIESIDVIIDALEKTRRMMVERMTKGFETTEST